MTKHRELLRKGSLFRKKRLSSNTLIIHRRFSRSLFSGPIPSPISDRNESQVNFDSLPCDSFDSRTDMEELALESLTVSHNGSGSDLRGGIRAKISGGSPTFETRNFIHDSLNSYEMNIADFKPKKILI